ncbi:MAG TPA: hypothetical protein DCM73_01525 [Clostridiales bacterium]|nr:hypothetical protein [Clostridiales bacterium]
MKKKIAITSIVIAIALLYFLVFYAMGIVGSLEFSQDTIPDHLQKVMLGETSIPDYISNKEQIKQLAKSPIEAVKQAGQIDKKILAAVAITLTVFIIYKMLILIIFNEQIANFLGFDKLIKDKKGTFGTARFAEKKDVHKMKKEGTLEENIGTVIGSTKKPYTMQPLIKYNQKHRLTVSPKAPMMNSHTIVVSGSGGGKTFSFVLTNGIKAILENASVVFTDPKGEIFETLSKYYEKHGYKVRALNLVRPEWSDRFNPIELIESELDALLFTQIILNNTNIDLDMVSTGNPFWEKGETNLFKALVLYLITYYPKEEQNMGNLYDLILNSNVKILDKLFNKVPDDTAMKRAYKVYAQGDEQVRAGIIIGLGSRLQIFQHDEIRRLTETNDIDIYDLKTRNAAFFLIIPDTHSAYDYIAGIFMNFLLVKLPALHDFTDDENIKHKKIKIIADEIANVGKIANLEKVITTLRSRKIDFYPIYQNLAQIKKAFGESWETITGNCDTFITLGVNDKETSMYISDQLGNMTIKTISKNKTDGLTDLTNIKRWSISEQKRELMQPQEVRELNKKKCIVFIRGEHPLLLWKCGYNSLEEYPEIKNLKINIKDYVPVHKRKEQEEEIEVISNTAIILTDKQEINKEEPGEKVMSKEDIINSVVEDVMDNII